MMNVNFAPINNNAQNWVNINTEMESEVDINVNSPSKGKESDKKDHEKEHDEEHEEDWENDEVDWHKDKMEAHWPLIKELLKTMTGRDCEEWVQHWEDTHLRILPCGTARDTLTW